jgi:hypothetical protein
VSGAVYILGALTSFACTVLLLRGYRRSGARLLLWSGLCFAGLTLENVILFFDLFIIHEYSLLIYRRIAALAALSILIFGMVWDSK